MRLTQTAAQWLFIACLPLLLITSNIRWAVNEIRLYEYGFTKYQVSQVTSLKDSELKRVARQLIDYFNSRVKTAQVRVTKDGKEFDLFNEQEIIHLQDVKGLIQLDYCVQKSTLAFIMLYSLALLIWRRSGSWRVLAGSILRGSILTLGLIVALALVAVFAFQQLFLFFHLVSFSNEYWMLNPSRDYLIMLFPEGFFYDAALFIAEATVAETLLLSGSALGVAQISKRSQRHRGCKP